jgi:hypothetical protein
MGTSGDLPNTIQKVLLACGILASLLYVGTDILAGLLKKGYRFDSQSGSVLSAFGTTTRPFVLPLMLTAYILLIAFAVGVWFSADRNWAMWVTAGLLAGYAVFSMVAIAFFPAHLDEAVNTRANTMNVIISAVSVLLFLLAIGFGAIANRDWFRYYSIGTLLVFVVLAIFRLSGVFPVPSGQSLVGVQERTMMYGELLWLVLQAIVLLRA